MYTIGEVSQMFNLPVSTLRYYDKQGMFKNIKRESSGIRKFSDEEIATLRMVECLKTSGMQLADIIQFLDWCNKGNSTLELRKNMFYEKKAEVEKQIAELNKTLDVINFKCWYYDTACDSGDEATVKKLIENDEIPEQFNYNELFNK